MTAPSSIPHFLIDLVNFILSSFIIKVKAAEITKSGKLILKYCLKYGLTLLEDQYHMGYTMRFPRALSIRDDLSIGDCLKASGAFSLHYLVVSLSYISTEVTESIISDKKRKMESKAT